MVLLLGRRDAGDKIGAIVGCKSEPEKPVLENIGAAEGVALAIDAGIGLAASGDGIVLRDPLEGIGVHNEIAGTGSTRALPLRPLSTLLKPPCVSAAQPLAGT